MLSSTFMHLAGVGRRTETRLWERGYGSWDRLARKLRSGIAPKHLLAADPSRPRSAIRGGRPDPAATERWLDGLQTGTAALARQDWGYFAERLPAVEHWRILADALPHALFLDIETTGLSRDLHALTIVGALYRGRLYQWAWPEAADQLSALLAEAAVLVTFNGGRFDVPFLQQHLPGLPAPALHIDLRYVAAHAGLKGGQKKVEEALGLLRPEELREMDGEQAVSLWCRTLYGDRAAYRMLLQYNREDVLMLRAISDRICAQRASTLSLRGSPGLPRTSRASVTARRAAPFEAVRSAWHERHTTIRSLEPSILQRCRKRMPVVVGIDLRGKAHNPTGMASCRGSSVEHAILWKDDEIFEWTLRRKPRLVSIDAPLSLPRGRCTPFDDDPTRKTHGIVRDAERILWRRGIRVYPALIQHMQGLTARGIDMTRRLQAEGIEVIESYPGAAQDVLGIPRKGGGKGLLVRGLRDFGFELPDGLSHDELDAVTSALVGYFYLADRYEGPGALDENFLIVPRADTIRWREESWALAM